MADVLSTGLSGLRALQRGTRYHVTQHRECLDGGLHPPARRISDAPGGIVRRRLDRHRRRDLDRAPRLRSVPRATDPQQRHQPRAARRVCFAGGAHRQPVRRCEQWIVELAAEVHRRPQRSFHDAGIDSGAPGADFRRTRTGRTPQDLRRAHARHVGRGQRPARHRSAGNHHARAGSRQAQRRNRGRHPAERPASQRPARPARCAHQRAVGQGERFRRRRRRCDTQCIHRQWPAAGARQPGLAGHHDRRPARSGANRAVHAHGRGHHGSVARRVRRNARRPARLAQPDARPGAQ